MAKQTADKFVHADRAKRTAPIVLGAAAMGVVTASIGVVAPPAYADEYPSWNDVQQAKASVAQQQALVDKINGLIGDLQQNLTDANIAASKAAEKYLQAQQALETATAKAEKLQKQADAAQKRSQTSKMRAGLLASHLAQSGDQDPSVNLMLKGSDATAADHLLYQLGTMSQLTQKSSEIYRQALSDKNESESLHDQAAAAKVERSKAADSASSALDASKTAAAQARSAMSEQQTKQTQLVSQLATLKNTSVQKETAYLAGEQKRKAEAAAAVVPPPAPIPPSRPSAPSRAATGSGGGHANTGGGGGHTSSGGGGSAPAAPPSASAVETAIAAAEAQLGKPYSSPGSPPSSFDCSGLTMWAYAAAGINIGGHSVVDQWYTAAARGQIVSYANRQRGDLIFWTDNGSPSGMYHVGIYLGGGMMIAAPDWNEAVKIQPVWGTPYGAVARPSA